MRRNSQPAPSPPAPPRPDITIDLQCVSLPQTLALPMIRQWRTREPAEEAKAMAQLEEAIDEGQAQLLGWPILTAPSGGKATHEGVDEIRFATEFASPTVGIFLTDQQGSAVEQPQPAVRASETEPMAVAFETRQIGLRFEATPTLTTEQNLIVIRYLADHVRLLSTDHLSLEHQRGNQTDKIIQEQPRFSSHKAQSQLNLTSGESALIGVFPLPGDKPTVELFILRAALVGKK